MCHGQNMVCKTWSYPIFWELQMLEDHSHQFVIHSENHVVTLANGGFQLVMGVPQARWTVFVGESPNLKWMMTRGTSIYGNPQIWKIMGMRCGILGYRDREFGTTQSGREILQPTTPRPDLLPIECQDPISTRLCPRSESLNW